MSKRKLSRHRQVQSIRQASYAVESLESRQLLTAVLGLTSTANLIQFDSASPGTVSSSTLITGVGAGESILDIDFRPANGLLYAVTKDGTNVGRLYTIDTGTGAATPVATLAADPADLTNPYTSLSGAKFGIDFNPVPDRLRVVSDSGQNVRINPANGLVTTDADLNPATPHVVSAAYTNSFAGATATTLYDIDSTLDSLMIQNPPNNGTLTAVGAGLGANTGDSIGFDILASGDRAVPTNTALATLNVAGTTGLYSIDLGTGAATLVGSVGGNPTLNGISIVPQPANLVQAANAVGVDASNNLVRFNTATPGTISSSTPITGLQPAETVLGIDARPSTGQFYLLGSTGRLYTVDTSTAAATLVAPLAADPADLDAPFTTLNGTSFGFAFNPVVDRIRVVSNTGQDMRINPDTGLVITDADLNPGTPNVVASAYTNSFVGATTTTLYDIDSASDMLVIQNPPNNGTVTNVGPLGVDASDVLGFDIRPGTNTAFATMVVGGTPGLYSIDLTTGAANPIGAIGGGTALGNFALVPNGTFRFTSPTYSIDEDGVGFVVVSVERVGGSDQTVSATFTTADGTATAPADYQQQTVTLTFLSGAVGPATIAIPIVNDADIEGNETFQVNLSNAIGGVTIGTPATATVTIVDDDSLVVTNTNDSGTGSLRNAMLTANAHTGADTITFAIQGAGVQTIHLASDLPTLSGPTTVDGYSQPGSSPNTLAVGDNAVLNVEINAETHGLFNLQGGQSTISGLVLNNFSASAINIGNNDAVVTGNFIGIDPTGTTAVSDAPGFPSAVRIAAGFNAVIGGADPADRNVLSGNRLGVSATISANASGTIQGNYIGTDRTGTLSIPNTSAGIEILHGVFKIGGTAPGEGNVVSGNNTVGISFSSGGNGSSVIGNLIGTAADRVTPLGNAGPGMFTSGTSNLQIGGLSADQGNTIAFNQGAGVVVGSISNQSGVNTAILSNRIYSNTGQGIDLLDDGLTANDPNDADAGPNDLQNFPVILNANSTNASTAVTGSFNCSPNSNFVLQFFSDPSSAGQGKTLLGQLGVTTDASGNATFAFASSTAVPAGQFVTATATLLTSAPFGDTSEFSPRIAVTSTLGKPSISVNDISLTEGNSGQKNFNFTVKLSHATNVPVTVHFKTQDGTALSTSDYTARNNTLTIPAGSTTGTVTVKVNGNTTAEPNETFFLKLDSPTNATISDNSGTATILNDDAGLPAINPGIRINDVNVAEGNSGTKTLTFTVTLSAATSKTVSVKYTTTDGTARTSDNDYTSKSGTLTFSAGQTSKTISITIKGDTKHENDESFSVLLSAAVNGSITDPIGIGTIKNDD